MHLKVDNAAAVGKGVKKASKISIIIIESSSEQSLKNEGPSETIDQIATHNSHVSTGSHEEILDLDVQAWV